MVEITVPFQNNEFVPAPEGTQAAICCGVILMGTFQTQFGPKKMLRLVFELHGPDRTKENKLFSVSQDFSFSSNENSALRKFIEGWRNKKYTADELSAMGGLPITKLLGQACLLSVSHIKQPNGSIWAGIKAAVPMPKGFPPPALESEKIIYSVDDHDAETFAKLPTKLQDRIKTSAEWYARHNPQPEPDHMDHGPDYQNEAAF